MKKVFKCFICLMVLALILVLGFFSYKYYKTVKKSKYNEESALNKEKEESIVKQAEEEKKKEKEKYLEENVYDNSIPISLYLKEGNSLVRADKVETDWTNEEVLGQFYALPSEEEKVTNVSYKAVFNELWAKYETSGYKIGYNLKLHFDTGETLNRTLLEPIRLSDEIFRYIQLYMYDDIAYDGTTRYYHLSPEEVKDTTFLSSLKLVGSTTTPGINGPIELTVFTYNGDEDFDKDSGEYLGKSKFTARIYREQK